VIRAAGGLVVRERGGRVEVLVVHRSAHGDWTFPKGKAKPGEADEACALREVEEETGLRCELERELPSVEYVDAQGRPKRVRYWRMRPLQDRIELVREVDDARWVSLSEARSLLSYARDVALLDSL
jgi:8-oxo-dGTP pyrophosphatase MutT (NUDIX family)